MDQKTLLIVSGGVEAAEAAKRAKDMGLYVVVSDINPNAPGFAFADSILIADVYGPSDTAAAAERFHNKIRKIDGVICVAADAPLTTAAVIERLGLKGISKRSAELACDKFAMKTQFAECGVPVPWFSAVNTPQELMRIVAERGPDLVIKPVDSRGSRGVQRLSHMKDLAKAFVFARNYSPSGRVMVEAYLPGPQVSTESVVVDGVCHTPGFSDRNYEYLDRYAPYFIENGGDLPSFLPADIQDEVKRVQAAAAAALGVTRGTVKGDIVVHEGKVYVIELAARLSGGFFCTREIPLNTGVDFIGAAIRVALGENPATEELTPKFQRPICQRYIIPGAGKVVSIAGAEEARAIKGVLEVNVTAKVGDVIPPAGDKRPSAAMVIASGDDRESAQEAAAAALRTLRITVQ
jgi:biotin carboxylase